LLDDFLLSSDVLFLSSAFNISSHFQNTSGKHKIY